MTNLENLSPWKYGEENTQGTHKVKVSYRVGVNLRASAYLHQGDRKYMEDEFQVAYQRTCDKKDIEYAFFGIFDGHGGKEAANFAKDHLMDNIVSLRSFWSDNDDDVLSAIKEGFLQTHLAMWKMLDKWPRTASGWPSTSGTTASIAFIRRQKIYIGHVGDSGIVLGYEEDVDEWSGEFLTTDHKPESADENARIRESGGKVVSKSGVPRIVWNRPKSGHLGPVRRSTPMDEIPFLAVARSLGDLWSYNANNNQFVVSPEPDVYVMDIDIMRHRCLIFGTDGLWNVLSPSAAVNIAYCTEKNNEMHYMGNPLACGKPRLWINPSRSIVKTGALERYQRVNLRADNTSAVTVFLDAPGPPKREVLLAMAMKKGTQETGDPQIAPKQPSREASVQVHVYNLNPQDERSRGMFSIKERVPEDWQNKNDSWYNVPESNQHYSGNVSSPPEGSSSSSSDSFSCSSSQSASQKDSFSGDNHLEDKETDSVAKCSECGCSNKANHSPSKADICSKAAESSSREETSANIPNRDDIQIPVISSSTVTAQKEALNEAVENKMRRRHGTVASETTRRRTRSCLPLLDSKSENKQHSPVISSHPLWKGQQSEITKPSSSRHRSMGDLSWTDSSNRVLRSINGTPNITFSSLGSAKIPSNKRKRSKDLLVDEPNSKSLRVLTRSHTWNHKSIITRSQDKTKKCKPK